VGRPCRRWSSLGEYDHTSQLNGLVTPLGTVPETGIWGLTLGGGLGWSRSGYSKGLVLLSISSRNFTTLAWSFGLARTSGNVPSTVR